MVQTLGRRVKHLDLLQSSLTIPLVVLLIFPLDGEFVKDPRKPVVDETDREGAVIRFLRSTSEVDHVHVFWKTAQNILELGTVSL